MTEKEMQRFLEGIFFGFAIGMAIVCYVFLIMAPQA